MVAPIWQAYSAMAAAGKSATVQQDPWGQAGYSKECNIELIYDPVVVVLQLGAARDAAGPCCFV